tara:strand:- start:609 stop:854 length:246 start_codon:yes stop_codon:yes gene_type:complete
MKMSKFILYTKNLCTFCSEAEELLATRGEQYTAIPFDDQPETLEQMKEAYAHQTVPMVFHMTGPEIKFVGGFTDLVDYLDE